MAIQDLIGTGIRRWLGATDQLVVCGHHFGADCTAQWCTDGEGNRNLLVLETVAAEGKASYFGRTISAEASEGTTLVRVCRLPPGYAGERLQVSIGGERIDVPPLHVKYQ